MQLITTIPPRRDGTVVVDSPDHKKRFVFKDDGTGQLCADVDDDATVAQLLRSENFYPANDADFDQAMALARPDGLSDGDGDGDIDPEDADDEGSVDALPVEAGTQPVAVTPAAVRRKRNG